MSTRLGALALVLVACGGPARPPVEIPPDRDEPDPVRAVLDAALAAKGQAVASLRTLDVETEGQVSTDGQTLDVRFRRVVMMPDKLLVTMTLDGIAALAYAVDGTTGWNAGFDPETGDPRVDALDLTGQAEVMDQLWRDPDLVLTRHLDPATTVIQLDAETVDGIACAVVNVTASDGIATATLYLDQDTKALVQLAYPEAGRVTVERFGDYRDVDGIQIAHDRSSASGEDSATFRVVRAEIDGEVDATIFRQPSY